MLVQSEMERECSPLTSIPPFGGDFQGIRVYRSDVGFLKSAEPKAPRSDYRLDEPIGTIARHGCVPAEPASVSPGKIIVAPPRPAVSTAGDAVNLPHWRPAHGGFPFGKPHFGAGQGPLASYRPVSRRTCRILQVVRDSIVALACSFHR